MAGAGGAGRCDKGGTGHDRCTVAASAGTECSGTLCGRLDGAAVGWAQPCAAKLMSSPQGGGLRPHSLGPRQQQQQQHGRPVVGGMSEAQGMAPSPRRQQQAWGMGGPGPTPTGPHHWWRPAGALDPSTGPWHRALAPHQHRGAGDGIASQAWAAQGPPPYRATRDHTTDCALDTSTGPWHQHSHVCMSVG